MRYAGVLIKSAVVALIWFAVVVVSHYGWIGADTTSPYGGNEGLTVFIVAFAIIAGLVMTERLFGLRLKIGLRNETPTPRKTTAIEPEALRLKDMIALLDEDDLDDLRAEVREGLRDRIRNLTADESESFEELLSDPKRKRRS
jgi:hypothetical protein